MQLARDSSQIMELSRSYDSLGIGMMRMNESLLLLQESVGNQQTSVEMVCVSLTRFFIAE